MTSSSLTIVGGSARAAAQSAVRAGFSPLASDMFGDVDLCQLCPTTRVDDYPAGLVELCSGPQSGSWMYTGALENHPQLIARMARIRPLLGNGPDILKRVRDPFELTAALSQAGFLTVLLSRTANDLPHDGTWLRKPYRSAGGAEISRWHGESSTAANAPRHYFQEYVAGEAFGALYVGNGAAARLLGVTRQLPATEGSFLYHGSSGPLQLDSTLSTQFERLGEFLAAEFELVGLFGVDVIATDEGIWPLEVNPRYTASVEILERALDFRAIEFHVAGCLKQPLPPSQATTISTIAGKQVLYAPREIRVPDEFPRRLQQQTQLPDAWPLFADIPAAGSVIRTGWPILTVLAEARDEFAVEESLRGLRRVVESILGIPPPDLTS